VSRPDPIGNAVRKARLERRLGPNAVCVLCGFADLAALVLVHRTFLEKHHVFAVAHVPGATVPLCRNCHAIQTERMRDAGIPLTDNDRSTLEVLEAVLRANAIFQRAQADAWESFADDTRRLIDDLDERDPGWRDLERARPE
jgi:hypothetical protein